MNAHSHPPGAYPFAPPASERPTLRSKEVAELLGYRDPASFASKRAWLEKLHGFPPRLPGIAAWSRAAVMRWIATNGATYAPAAADDGLAAERAALEGEYGT